MIYTIPIEIEVDATEESKGEKAVFDFLKNAMKEYGAEYRIADWYYFDKDS